MTLIAEKPSHPPVSLPDLRDHERFSNRKRWTRAEVAFLETVGTISGRYELLDGEIVPKMGQNRPRIVVTTRAFSWLIGVYGVGRVQCQADIEVGTADQETNSPQSDVAVLSRPDIEFSTAPNGADLLLVVEVSDSTLKDDLATKAALYARAGIAEFWVIDVQARRLYVHLRPENGTYSEIRAFKEDEMVGPSTATARCVLSSLLPPASLAC